MKIKDIILSCGSFMIRDGAQMRFWKDTWVGHTPFKYQFSTIFNIAHDQHATVAIAMSVKDYNVLLKRTLVGDNL
jgi:hypothetical protein